MPSLGPLARSGVSGGSESGNACPGRKQPRRDCAFGVLLAATAANSAHLHELRGSSTRREHEFFLKCIMDSKW